MTNIEKKQLGFITRQVELQSHRPWKNVIQESIGKIKGYCADQNNNNHENNFNDIIAPNEDIDNGEVTTWGRQDYKRFKGDLIERLE